MKVTYYGHACFAVEVAGRRLLFDPYITENELARPIRLDSIQADYVFISHGHDDHMADAEAILLGTGATLVSAYEVSEWFGKKGIKQRHAMNHGGSWSFDFGRAKCVSAIHSSVLPDGTYGGNAVGFVIESSEGNFYYSGDTALTLDMKLIGEATRLDFAVLCLGDNFTMGIDDAIRAAQFVECDQIIGVHYDTFPEIRIDRALAVRRFRDAGKYLRLPEIGDTMIFSEETSASRTRQMDTAVSAS